VNRGLEKILRVDMKRKEIIRKTFIEWGLRDSQYSQQIQYQLPRAHLKAPPMWCFGLAYRFM